MRLWAGCLFIKLERGGRDGTAIRLRMSILDRRETRKNIVRTVCLLIKLTSRWTEEITEHSRYRSHFERFIEKKQTNIYLYLKCLSRETLSFRMDILIKSDFKRTEKKRETICLGWCVFFIEPRRRGGQTSSTSIANISKEEDHSQAVFHFEHSPDQSLRYWGSRRCLAEESTNRPWIRAQALLIRSAFEMPK